LRAISFWRYNNNMPDTTALSEPQEKPTKTGVSFLGVALTSALITSLILGFFGYQLITQPEKFLPLPPPPATHAAPVDLTPIQTQLDAQGMAIQALQEKLETFSATAATPSPADTARIEALERNLADLPELRAQLGQLSLIQQNIGQQLELQREVERQSDGRRGVSG
jgi:hypothetical protein